MSDKINKNHRQLFPKIIRDPLGQIPVGDYESDEIQAEQLGTTPSRSSLTQMGYSGAIPPGFDILSAINEDRNERTRKYWGDD